MNKITKKRKKVLIAGTFDIIHPGHIYLIKEARKYGDVFVIVSRAKNAMKLKGKPPVIPDSQRLEVVKNIKGIKKAVLGDETDMFLRVKEINPDLILLGPNQPFKEDVLESKLLERGINAKVVRLKEQYDKFPFCSTSKIIESIIARYCNKKKH